MNGTRAPMAFARISVDPHQCDGLPCMRDLRIPVATVAAMAPEGMTLDQIIAKLSDLEIEDVREALHFAAEAVREYELPMLYGYAND